MHSHTLFPTDSSDCADAALDHTIEHARTYDATLVALCAADVCEIGYAAPALSLKRIREALLESGEQMLDCVAQAAREAGVKVEIIVTKGTPASETVHHADEREMDLAVMRTHGHSDIDHYLVRSIAECVVRDSGASVLTVRQESS